MQRQNHNEDITVERIGRALQFLTLIVARYEGTPGVAWAQQFNGERWPRWMRAETAAAYVDEVSVEALLRSVGSLYPRPLPVSGKGNRWRCEDLDSIIDEYGRRAKKVRDAADLL
jgi:hypothetical protein